jgi:transposase
MPAPIPLPLRQALWQRFQQGHSPARIARDLDLHPRSVRRLLDRLRHHGPDALVPSYHTGAGEEAADSVLRHQVLAWRQQHPTWGAGLLRVLLQREGPHETVPSERTLQRWRRQAGLHPAPAGRRPAATYRRADQPHQVWQMDAAELVRLRSGQRVSWLRVVDECSGAVLGTTVFPPREVAAGAAPVGASRAALRLRPLGSATRVPRR